jgi:hypothetical protein
LSLLVCGCGVRGCPASVVPGLSPSPERRGAPGRTNRPSRTTNPNHRTYSRRHRCHSSYRRRNARRRPRCSHRPRNLRTVDASARHCRCRRSTNHRSYRRCHRPGRPSTPSGRQPRRCVPTVAQAWTRCRAAPRQPTTTTPAPRPQPGRARQAERTGAATAPRQRSTREPPPRGHALNAARGGRYHRMIDGEPVLETSARQLTTTPQRGRCQRSSGPNGLHPFRKGASLYEPLRRRGQRVWGQNE